MPIYETHCTKIYCVGQPPSAAPASAQQATQREQQNKNYQTNPISPNPSQISILQPSSDPAPRSATEIPGRGMASGFRSEGLEETRGFSRPSKP